MYTRVTTLSVQPEKIDELTAIFRDSIGPAMQQQLGFNRLLLLTDAASGKAMSVSVWTSEAEWAVSETSGVFQAQLPKLAGILTGAPVREAYTLSVEI